MTFRLLDLANSHWTQFNGWAIENGIKLRKLSVADLSNLIEWWATKNLDQQGLNKFNQNLWRPPPGEVANKGPWSADQEMSAFQSLKSQIAK